MKICTKCHRELSESCFVKSPRYLDGLYPSCKECRKKVMVRYLAEHPLCSKCNLRPHQKGTGWCYECEAEKTYAIRPKKFNRKPNTKNPNYCSMCGIRPPRDYSCWCQPCFNAYQRKRNARLRGNPRKFRSEQKRKQTARKFINTLVRRNKIKYGPCYLCGEQSVNKHHLNYKDRTRDVIDFCHRCHVLVHRALKYLLTLYNQGV